MTNTAMTNTNFENITLTKEQTMGARCTAGLFFHGEPLGFVDEVVGDMGGEISSNGFTKGLKAIEALAHVYGFSRIEIDIKALLNGELSVAFVTVTKWSNDHKLFFEDEIEGFGAKCLMAIGLYLKALRG